jgi:phosphatidate phosphatase PAH1
MALMTNVDKPQIIFSTHTIVHFFLQSTLHQSNANELECKETIQKDMQHSFEIQKRKRKMMRGFDNTNVINFNMMITPKHWVHLKK